MNNPRRSKAPHKANAPKPNARVAAAETLSHVLDGGATLDDAMTASKAYARLAGRDRAFARAMASAALRRLGSIDAILNARLSRPLDQTAPLARALLRIGAAQILCLDTPPHAAVGETVTAARIIAPKFAGLMNAVLRRVAEEDRAKFDAQPPGSDLPNWLFARWRAAYGEHAAHIAEALRHEPPLDISVKADAKDWATRLLSDLTPTGAVRLSEGHAPIAELPGFNEGAWWVQDAAAALPAKLLGDVRGKRVLDLCAAPGGKTLQLAAAGARVTALDIAAERLETLKENLARTRLEAEIVIADAREFRPAELFDAILLDAPCTATGTLRRHPEAAWLRRPDDIRRMSALQTELIAATRAMLKPGGVLVYAVCSLEPEEGPGAASAALSNGWRRLPLTPEEFPAIADFITKDGDLRTTPAHWPDIGGMDGFYAVRLTAGKVG